jgi:hypothetical protein
VVEAVLDADESAVLVLFCVAELDPPPVGDPMVWVPTETPLPLTVTGTLALTAF